MTAGKQTQRAGQGAQQIQVAGDLIVGIDEARAKEIAVVTARNVIAEYTDEAIALVQVRIDALDSRVIETLEGKDQLEAFGDPAFQRTYRKAQSSAASSERETDYDMLAALLSDRAANPRDRRAITGIERAIEIVDMLDDEALRAITIIEAMRKWSPNSASINEGLDVLEALFSQLLDGPLPTGFDWAEHLDILDAARVNHSTEFKKYDDYSAEKLGGYSATGVRTEDVPEFLSPEFPFVRWETLTMEHELRPGFTRVSTPNIDTLERALRNQGAEEPMLDEILVAARSMFGVGQGTDESIQVFKEALRSRPSLNEIGLWWDQIPKHVVATAVGKKLAMGNMIRLDSSNQIPREE
ncbi:LPO_1073/Vpar_1526 family protein [Microbacterium sp. LBN7]|uniref:LPO_1073/Vpar_1526 family protein n=1 Tax=Microbacterium sp. LBN7 TaxID=3129773 RepID=UPI0032540D52